MLFADEDAFEVLVNGKLGRISWDLTDYQGEVASHEPSQSFRPNDVLQAISRVLELLFPACLHDNLHQFCRSRYERHHKTCNGSTVSTVPKGKLLLASDRLVALIGDEHHRVDDWKREQRIVNSAE